jgi:hypothetical protein
MMIERVRLMVALLLGAILLLGAADQLARAQDGGDDDGDTAADDTLLLFGVDPASPTLLQPLASGDLPDPDAFTRRVTLTAEDQIDTPLIYVAIANAGWSAGALGLISHLLEANEAYILAEVRDRGMAGYTVREDGQGLVFDLVYEPDLDTDGAPGFRFDVLIGQPRTFRVFRVEEEGGLLLLARTSVLTETGRVQDRRQVHIDPEPVFGDLLFEFHIESLPEVVEEADEGAGVESGDADGDGVPDAEDECPDAWGGLPNGCMSNWDPGGDGAEAVQPGSPEYPVEPTVVFAPPADGDD